MSRVSFDFYYEPNEKAPDDPTRAHDIYSFSREFAEEGYVPATVSWRFDDRTESLFLVKDPVGFFR